MSTHPPSPPSPASGGARRLVRTALIFYGLLLAAALAWRGGLAGESLLYAGPGSRAEGLDPLPDAALGATAAAAVIALSWVWTRRSAWGERLARALAGLLGRPTPGQIAVLALASSVGEEAFFRGALQPRVGLVAASFVFGLAHFVPRREFLPWTAFSIAAGFLLGALFQATGNLVAPVVTHALVNGVNLTLLTRRFGPPADVPQQDHF